MKHSGLGKLTDIMERLLGEGGCPWDREQTLETLRPFVIEEAHEVVDAIDKGDMQELKEELGDLLLQVVFQSALASKAGAFGLADVLDAICDKMVRRHPHVFGDEHAENSADVLVRWEQIKATERAKKTKKESVLSGVPKHLPALLKGVRVAEKAASIGLEFKDSAEAWEKVEEELYELKNASNTADVEEELGDVFFALCNWARKNSIDPEAVTRASIAKFTGRVMFVEQRLDEGRDGSVEGLDALWKESKNLTRV